MRLIALGGDSLSAPEDTMPAYWAGLGGGADEIALRVRLTADRKLVCIGHDTLLPTCGDPRRVDDVTLKELQTLDAGSTFRSTTLDGRGQPVGRGADVPWIMYSSGRRRLYHPSLADVLRVFGRRTRLQLVLPQLEDATNFLGIAGAVSDLLDRFGLAQRIDMVAPIAHATRLPKPSRIVKADPGRDPSWNIDSAHEVGAEVLQIDMEKIVSGDHITPAFSAALAAKPITLQIGSDSMPFAPTPEQFDAIRSLKHSTGLVFGGVLPTSDLLTPRILVLDDTFEGKVINSRLWTAGYSHSNQDTRIYQDNGLHIAIEEGRQYSGAAAVTKEPICGRFDAQTSFQVEQPQQATTFELAAITVDPGEMHISNITLDDSKVNLTFDVHGAPPYASCERDEADGFRFGWNNSLTPTRYAQDWHAWSVNMYNKYGRDVGDGHRSNPVGHLRLIRNGSIFASYYRDKHNTQWVSCGAGLVHNIGTDVFLRVAAKHWLNSNGKSPPNHIVFRSFKLFQY